ncbi:hypothetical protein A2W24_06530 [Microgenomates group bacterium RBG_16_45_19]|nr:MAG: hypothetical protein A2W24_06530 [Microgenomates group bacterium RBG_16_45_19]
MPSFEIPPKFDLQSYFAKNEFHPPEAKFGYDNSRTIALLQELPEETQKHLIRLGWGASDTHPQMVGLTLDIGTACFTGGGDSPYYQSIQKLKLAMTEAYADRQTPLAEWQINSIMGFLEKCRDYDHPYNNPSFFLNS